MDILGPFPIAAGQKKFLVVAINHFTKWLEAKLLAIITPDHPQTNGMTKVTNQTIL